MAYYKDSNRLKDEDRLEMNEVLRVGESFRDILTRREDEAGQPDAFFTADRHYFDDTDYQDHRHKNYPHMHQPLKSLNPHELRKSRPKKTHSTSESTDEESIRKRRKKQQQKEEQFSPTLDKVTERKQEEASSSISSESDIEASAKEKKKKKKIRPFASPQEVQISVKTNALSFLEEIHSESKPQSYHDLTGLDHILPLPISNEAAPIQSMTSVEREEDVRTDRPRKISFFIDEDQQKLTEVKEGEVHSSLAPEVNMFRAHRYDKKDLKHRIRHGDQLRRSFTTSDFSNATEPEEACHLCQSDLECMHDHRTVEIKGYRRHRVYDRFKFQPPQSEAAQKSLYRQTSASAISSTTEHSRTITPYSADQYPIYVQLDELRLYPKSIDQLVWQERIRWIRFEETYNEEACRFDPAHSSPIKFHTMLQFRRLFQQGCIILDIEADSFETLCQYVVTHLIAHNHCNNEEALTFLNLLSVPHLRAGEKLPELSSFNRGFSRDSSAARKISAERSFGKSGKTEETPPSTELSIEEAMTNAATRKISSFCMEGESANARQKQSRPRHTSAAATNQFHSDLAGHLRPNTEAMSVWVGEVVDLKHSLVLLIRLANTIYKPTLNEIDDLPIKFVFIAIGPTYDDVEYLELGRVMATCMTDDKFRSDIYNAQDKSDIMEALSLFLDNSIVLPVLGDVTVNSLGGMLSQIQAYQKSLETKGLKQIPETVNEVPLETLIQGPNAVVLKSGDIFLPGVTSECIVQTDATAEPTLVVKLDEVKKVSASRKCAAKFCPPFSSLTRDLKGFKSRFVSDFKDAFIKENLSVVLLAMLFVFFTCLAPAITFGALLNALVSDKLTITLTLIASGIYEFVFALCGGQPLLIIGVTGPVYIIENAINMIAQQTSMNPIALRFWVSVYCAVFGLIIQILNLDLLVKHIRRSVEEIFNAFIGIFFLIKAMIAMCNLIPIRPNQCCNLTAYPESATEYLTFSQRNAIAGATFFLAFIMLIICLKLLGLKQSRMFRRRARTMIGSFNVPIGILIVVVLERLMFPNYNMPKLNIPSGDVDVSRWVNIPDYGKLLEGNVGAMHGAGIGIGFLMCIVIATETCLSGISVAKAEKKIQKPCLFSLDLLFVLVIFPLVSGFIGWPFVTAALVRSVSHGNALAKFDPKTPPGVPNKQIGCAEQRFTGVVVGILVALSIFLGVILRLIPMAAMYGMFLFMGVTSLRDLFVVRRLFLLMKRKKYWPNEELCCDLPASRIAVFVCLQILVVAILTTLDCITEFMKISYTSLVFPAVIIVSAIFRETALPKWTWLNIYLGRMDKIHPVVLPQADVRRIKLDDGKTIEYNVATQEITDLKENNDSKRKVSRKSMSMRSNGEVELNSYVNQTYDDNLV